MSRKSEKVAALIESCRGRDLDPHYLGYFECFNRGEFYEAHDVLEELWLPQRQGPNGAFYKGLIQLAGAFVHLQKGRPGPAVALFKLALANLGQYPMEHESLAVERVRAMIGEWLARAATEGTRALRAGVAPKLSLRESALKGRVP
jgi:predicted metal-dependent hydrolase